MNGYSSSRHQNLSRGQDNLSPERLDVPKLRLEDDLSQIQHPDNISCLPNIRSLYKTQVEAISVNSNSLMEDYMENSLWCQA
jgi:hypothetical protein